MSNRRLLYRAFIVQIVGLFFLKLTVYSRTICRRDINIISADVARTDLEQVKSQPQIFQPSRVVDQNLSITKPAEFPDQNRHRTSRAKWVMEKLRTLLLCGYPVSKATDIKPNDALATSKVGGSMRVGSAGRTQLSFVGVSLGSSGTWVKSDTPVLNTLRRFDKKTQLNGRKARSAMTALYTAAEELRRQEASADLLRQASASLSVQGPRITGPALWPYTELEDVNSRRQSTVEVVGPGSQRAGCFVLGC